MNDHRFFSRLKRLIPMALVAVSWCGFNTASVFGQAGFTDEQFEQWVFQQYGNASTARTKLTESLELHLEDVHDACSLSTAQTRKLKLAGRGDIGRFFRKYDEVKEKFQKIRNDQQQANLIFQDISPLQMQLYSGLHNSNSLLQKSLVNTLTRQQFLSYEKLDAERQQFHHEARIRLVVSMLDQMVPLTAEQRRRLIDLIREETKPPRISGQYDYYAMMYQVGKIAEPRLKPLLDDIQWQVFKQQLAQMQGIEQWLNQNGILLDEEDEDERLLPDEKVAAE